MLKGKGVKTALISLALNIPYSAYHMVFGIIEHSWWLFTVGVYYAFLSIMRVTALITKASPVVISRGTGVMLTVMSLPLCGIVVLSYLEDRGRVLPMYVMLGIAVYAFAKITLASVKWIKARKSSSLNLIALRNISFASAFVSVFSLQRSMLVTFEGMTQGEIRIMNVATGSAVCVIVFLLGVNLLKRKMCHTT